MRRAKSGARLGKYILGKKIGEGGFGVVRCGVHEDTGDRVAIKILDKSQAQMMHMTPQVKKEIGLLTTLRHENIVSGVEVLSSSTRLFLIMELVNGGDMHSLVTKKKRLGVTETRTYFRCILKALHYCHSQGVYHRDLKLENLLLTKDGNLKICDFGLASVTENSKDSNANTLLSTMVGTEDYAAPEIVLGKAYAGNKVDMWSAGVILFTMLAGYCPFLGSEDRSINQDIVKVKYSFPKNFPAEVREVVKALLVFSPEKRPTAEEVLKMPWIHDPEDDARDAAARADTQEVPELKTESRVPAKDSVASQSTASSSQSSMGSTMSFSSAARLIDDFPAMYGAMRDPKTGIIVADRRFRFRVFTKSFLGNEAISWIAKYKRVTRDEALIIGQEMMDAGVFHHVCKEHSLSDDYLFYRFQEDDPANAHVLNIRQIWSQTQFTREPAEIARDLLLQLMKICSAHQSAESKLVDVPSVKKDVKYLMFRNSTAELQTVNLVTVSDSEKMAFLVNVHNLLLMHSRIHMGRYTGTHFDQKVRKFKYDIGGVSLSSDDLKSLFLVNRNSLEEDDESDSPNNVKNSFSRSSSLRSEGGGTFFKIFSNAAPEEHDPEDMQTLAPSSFKPYVLFALSDGSPGAPPIQPVSTSDMANKELVKFPRNHITRHIETVRLGHPATDNMEAFRFFYESSKGFSKNQYVKQVLDWIDETLDKMPGRVSDKFELVQKVKVRSLLLGKEKGKERLPINYTFVPFLSIPEH